MELHPLIVGLLRPFSLHAISSLHFLFLYLLYVRICVCFAGIGKLSTADGKAFADPEVLRKLTSSVSCALDEAAAALTRMRAEQQAEGTAPADR